MAASTNGHSDVIYIVKDDTGLERHFLIRRIQSDFDKQSAVEFMNANWASIHTLSKNLGLDAEAIDRFWQVVYKRAFKHPISLIVYALDSDDIAAVVGEVAGLKMNSIYEGEMLRDVMLDSKYKPLLEAESARLGKLNGEEMWTEEDVRNALSHLMPLQSKPEDKFSVFLAVLWKDLVRRHMPDCKRLLKFDNLALNSKYTRLGLGQQLVHMSLELGRQYGCDYVATSASVLASQCVQRKCGLACVRRIKYLDIKGDPAFQKWEGDVTEACEMLVAKL